MTRLFEFSNTRFRSSNIFSIDANDLMTSFLKRENKCFMTSSSRRVRTYAFSVLEERNFIESRKRLNTTTKRDEHFYSISTNKKKSTKTIEESQCKNFEKNAEHWKFDLRSSSKLTNWASWFELYESYIRNIDNKIYELAISKHLRLTKLSSIFHSWKLHLRSLDSFTEQIIQSSSLIIVHTNIESNSHEKYEMLEIVDFREIKKYRTQYKVIYIDSWNDWNAIDLDNLESISSIQRKKFSNFTQKIEKDSLSQLNCQARSRIACSLDTDSSFARAWKASWSSQCSCACSVNQHNQTLRCHTWTRTSETKKTSRRLIALDFQRICN
jgi:hypothetical protein